jgi:hypothetical protein
MRFDDYEKKYEPLYAELAETVKFILEKAIENNSDTPRIQSIQFRAKTAGSLKPKLEARSLLALTQLSRDKGRTRDKSNLLYKYRCCNRSIAFDVQIDFHWHAATVLRIMKRLEAPQ